MNKLVAALFEYIHHTTTRQPAACHTVYINSGHQFCELKERKLSTFGKQANKQTSELAKRV